VKHPCLFFQEFPNLLTLRKLSSAGPKCVAAIVWGVIGFVFV